MLFVGHQQLFPPSVLPSFLQGEALEVGSIWVLLVQKTGLGFCCLLGSAESEREPPPPSRQCDLKGEILLPYGL